MKAVVSEKGQVTIPKPLRDELGIRPGAVLEFRDEQGTLVASKVVDEDPIDAAYGILPPIDVDRFLDATRGSVGAC